MSAHCATYSLTLGVRGNRAGLQPLNEVPICRRDWRYVAAGMVREEARMPGKFRSKNLTGTGLTVDRKAAIPLALNICLLRTRHRLPWMCNGATPPDRFAESQGDPQTYRGQLAALKADLRAALADVQAHEELIRGLAKQESRLALAELESGLQDALRQVAQMKRQKQN